MGLITFLVMCIEFYAEHIHSDSSSVYSLFVRENIFDLLVNDYEDLHGMSTEYIMQLLDQYIINQPDMCSSENITVHAMYNATITPEIVKLISEKYGITEQEAMDAFYKSETAKALNDPETGLYGQSALFIFSQYVMEKEQQK